MNPVFSAAAGVTVTETGGSTDIAEEMATTDTYDIALKSVPAGSVEITATADAQAELSLNGTDFFAAVMLTFTDMTPQTVTVRAIEDGTPEATPHSGTITHAVTTTNDPADYPLSTTIADVIANIEDNDTPGVTITETSGSTDVDEQGQTTDTFDVSLDTAPAGNVTVRLQITDGETEISTNGGVSYGTEFFLNFTDTTPQTITVRPIDDSDFEGPHTGSVLLDISATNDLGDYPTGPAGSLTVNITDNDFMPPPTDLYLNEVVVDLDGVGDNPNEYIEVRGPAGAPLAGIYLLMVDGDGAASGDVDAVIDLTSYSIGSDGFLVIVDDAADLYTISPGTSIVDVPGLDFENASYSALLLHNGGGPVPTVGGDLDVDNDGLDPLPPGYTIVDGVSALDGTVGDRGYAPIVFSGTAEGLTETGATFVDTGFGSDDVIHMMRIGDSIGSTTADWVAFELDDASVPPDFLIEFSTDPAYEVGAVITDHLGASNPTSAMAPALHVIIDNGDVGYSTVGTWASNVNAAARDGDIENSLFGRGQNVASWNFTGLTPGNYRVSATWVEHPNRATNSPFRAVDSDGTTILNATTIDQEVAPDDFMDDGTLWEDLFVVTATGTELTIELSNAANQYVVADAIRIVPTADPASPFAPIIDNGDPGFASSGSWNTPSGILGHQNDLIHHAPGSTGDTATWTFTGLTPGNYYVSATWLASANRSMEAPFTIIDGPGGPTVEIAIVDQTIAPDDFSDQGSMWGTDRSGHDHRYRVACRIDRFGRWVRNRRRHQSRSNDRSFPATRHDH
ncbi:MAG: hypothetical protein R3B91_16165 [Planctomycetaceae bacterium]